ncbi:MAG: TerB N-terminal domain-containing protein, partial [Thermomicrobiales bacterium]
MPRFPSTGQRVIRVWSRTISSRTGRSPEDRGAYLEWLAGGREAPDALRSFIRLFMAGLERRLFVDILADPTLRWEIPFIRSVLVALQETYRTRMYQGFTDRLLEMIDHMEVRPATVDLTPPPLIGSAWDTPLDLKIGLGSFTAQRMPIPAGWAVCWAWFRP